MVTKTRRTASITRKQNVELLPSTPMLITMLTWGLWITFANYASKSIDPVTAAAISYGTAMILTIGYGIASGASPTITPRGGTFAVVSGVFAAMGLVATYIGLSIGSTATVTTIGALYFVVAAVIGRLFSEIRSR